MTDKLPPQSVGFRNCEFTLRAGDAPLPLRVDVNGTPLFEFDGYAILPKEELPAFLPIDEGVTQADRDRAASTFRALNPAMFGAGEGVVAGQYDFHPVVQAFRAHRVAALRGSQS